MRTLITGVTGFIGGHLVEHLHAVGGHDLVGLGRAAKFAREWAHLDGTVRLHKAELADTPALAKLLAEIRPHAVYHLAGYSNPRDANQKPEHCWADNFGGTQSLYRALEQADLRPRILQASTGHVYGSPTLPEQVCDETAPLNGRGPYAESKQAAEELSREYADRKGFDIVRVRLFNQIGPRQAKGFIVSDYAGQIAEVEAGHRAAIELGDLSGWRDFTDVRDVVVALRLLIETPHDVRGQVYNAATGEMRQLEGVVKQLLQLANTSLYVKQSPAAPGGGHAFRRIDATRLKNLTGWQPRTTLDRTLSDTLDYWRTV